jgi:alginate O-acetyltransferase complex protein AlgI
MVFSSLVFLFRFLPLVLIVYYLAPKRCRNFILFVFSLVFYAWGEPVYVVLMLFSTIWDYTLGRLIGVFHTQGKKGGAKICLFLSLLGNLGLLMVFKYADFAIVTANQITSLHLHKLNLSLPVGISFYTFQTLSYTIDVYRRKVKPQKNFVTFAAYVSLFPQLIAGPIVRYETVEKELHERTVSLHDFSQGAFRFSVGLAKKVLIANSIGGLFDEIGALDMGNLSTATAWLGVLAFTFQIYFDFSGYSDMAIGLGRMFGFHFLENFDYPYESASVTEFWRKWHISLSTWFKEYVYIPLGGNRKGMARQLMHIAIVWLLTGLWHGASWNFVLWGVYYAFLLIMEKLFLLRLLNHLPKLAGHLYTILAFVGGWAIFCICDVKEGMKYAFTLLGRGQSLVNQNFMYYLLSYAGLFLLAALGATSIPARVAKRIPGQKILRLFWIAICLLLSLSFLVADTYNPFLYFRF